MTLNDVKLNKSVRIISINCNSSLKERLYDLGLIQNTIVTPVFSSPLGDPIAYEFRGNIIAIRNSDAKKIIV